MVLLYFLVALPLLFFFFSKFGQTSRKAAVSSEAIAKETKAREAGWGLLTKYSTDLTHWRLDIDRGRQVWRYHQDSPKQRAADKYFLGLDISKEAPALSSPKNAREAARNGVEFYCKIQMEDGHWGNDYGGPMFLLPGLIFVRYIANVPFTEEQRSEMARYLFNEQNEDGGWGM